MIIYLKNQGGYKMSYFKGMKYEDIRPIFESVWDQTYTFVPKDFEIEKEVMKRSGFDLQQESTKQVKEEMVDEQVVKESSKPSEGRRRKTLARKRASDKQSKESSKRQKHGKDADYEQEKEELRMWLTVVQDEEETVDPEILSTKYPIVDWESQILSNINMEDLHVYKIIRVDGNTSYHKSLASMLRKFDRQDLEVLHRLVMERFKDKTPEGYELLLWGDLKVMFEPNARDEVWSNQQDWSLISWKLYEHSGVHTLLLEGTLTNFNLLVEKRYPLTKEMMKRMLNWKLEAETESTMAFELLKFIKSQIEE
ncbi:hypothetical protein Tco_1302931 [Tanacetum coccineum]